MSVTVYPRLNELLRERRLSVAELERRIERRFGLAVDPKTLYRLNSAESVQRADLEIAGAVAAVLDVGLGDLFDVHVVPGSDGDEAEATEIDPAESRRLAELFDRQAYAVLSEEEQHELDGLVTSYGRRLHERRLHELAQQRGIPLEQARREVAEDLEQALAWWRTFEADPQRRAVLRSWGGRGRRRGAR
jgi:transposase